MPITKLPPLRNGRPHSDLTAEQQVDLLAHCNEQAPRDLAELRKVWNAKLRKITSAIRKHGDPGYQTSWEEHAHPEVLAARTAADQAQAALMDAEAVEQRKMMWAIQMAHSGKFVYKTFRQCLQEDLVAQLPEEITTDSWRTSFAYVGAPVAAREAFYDLPLSILTQLHAFGGNSSPPPAAVVRLSQEALVEARAGWDPLAVEAFKATDESRALRKQHKELLKTRFFKRLVDAYAYDRDSFEGLVATDAYRAVGRSTSASQSQAFAKKATAGLELILVRSAIRHLGPEDAAHLFNRIALATQTDRPSIMEFFHLLENYNGGSYFPGVPEFDLKPAWR